MFLDNLRYPLLVLVASTTTSLLGQQLTPAQELILRNCRNEPRSACFQTASNLTIQPVDNLFMTPRDMAIGEWIGLRKELTKWPYEQPTPQEALVFRNKVDAFFMQAKSANTTTVSFADTQRSIKVFFDQVKNIKTLAGKTPKVVSKLGKLESAFSRMGITVPLPEYLAGR